MAHRRRETSLVPLLSFYSSSFALSFLSFILLPLLFPLFKPFQTLSNLRILVRSTTIKNKKRRWCPAISILHAQHVSPLRKSSMVEPINSKSEDLLSLWFFSYAFVGLHCISTPTRPPSPYDGGCLPSRLSPAKRNLVSQLVGLFSCGPLSFQKPSPEIGDPSCFVKPRSVSHFPLSILSHRRDCLLSFVRRLQREETALLLLWLSKISLRTLPLDSPRICYHEFISFAKKGFVCPTPNSPRTLPLESYRNSTHVFTKVKKTGIMVTSPNGGDYRSFFKPVHPQPLITITTHVQLSYLNEDVLTLKCLDLKSGLLLMLQTDYKLCVDFLNLHGRRGLHAREDPPVMLRLFKLSSITPSQTLVKALLCVVVLVPARTMTLAPSLTPIRLSTMAIRSSIDSLLEDLSIIFDLTCTKKFHSFWLKALKELLSINLIYLFIYCMLALGNAFSYCTLNFGISCSYPCTWFLF